MTRVAQPTGGWTAYVPVPDALFPYEVVAFALFGAAFLVASFYHFRQTFRTLSDRQNGRASRLFLG